MHPLFNLSGRVALVTGGSKGLGKAMARGFAEAGADVVISSRHEEELKKAQAEIQDGLDVKVVYFVADMTNRADVKRLAEDATQALGRVDILVNNAGSNVPQPIDKITDEAWDQIVELNLTSCMALTRAVVPQMMQLQVGPRDSHLVDHGRWLPRMPAIRTPPPKAHYWASPGPVRWTWVPTTSRSIASRPGPFLTDLPGSLLSPEQKKALGDRTALGRWGDPRELAGPALLLASEAGSYITGEVLVVDGGSLAKTF